MIGQSHVLIGTTGYTVAAAYSDLPFEIGAYGAAILGSLAPDLDHPRSLLGQLTWPLSAGIGKLFGHRALTHSLLALAGVGYGATELWKAGHTWAPAGAIGYAFHIGADLLTRGGVGLWTPLSHRRVHLPFAKLRTGSVAEAGTVIVLLAAMILALALEPELQERLRGLVAL